MSKSGARNPDIQLAGSDRSKRKRPVENVVPLTEDTSDMTASQFKRMKRRIKAGKTVQSAEERRAQREQETEQRLQKALRTKMPPVKFNVPADCELNVLSILEPELYASVTGDAVPIPSKSDNSHRTRTIWFNDLNKRYTFNRTFQQARMLYTSIHYRHSELMEYISPIERQFVAACLEHDLKDRRRTGYREGFIDLWMNTPDSALTMFGSKAQKNFTKFTSALLEALPNIEKPLTTSNVEPMKGPKALPFRENRKGHGNTIDVMRPLQSTPAALPPSIKAPGVPHEVAYAMRPEKKAEDSDEEEDDVEAEDGEEDEIEVAHTSQDANTRAIQVIADEIKARMMTDGGRDRAHFDKMERLAEELRRAMSKAHLEQRLGEMEMDLHQVVVDVDKRLADETAEECRDKLEQEEDAATIFDFKSQ